MRAQYYDIFEEPQFLNGILLKISQNICSIYNSQNNVLPKSEIEAPFMEEMVYLFLAILNQEEENTKLLFEGENQPDVLIPLLIMFDQQPKTFENGLYYALLSIFLRLMSCNQFCKNLYHENFFSYKFENLPLISGYVIDYLVCFFLQLTYKKTLEKDFQSTFIYNSILKNISFHSIALSESTSQTFVQVVGKLEDYELIFEDLNQLSVLLNLLSFAERVLVFHWKTNTVFGSYLIENSEMFDRILDLTDDEEKFTILVFNEKVKVSEGDKTLQLEIDPNEETHLKDLIFHIRNIKQHFKLQNLKRFFVTTQKHMSSIKSCSEINPEPQLQQIKNFLGMFSFENFFAHSDNMAEVNLLNNKD